MPLRDKIMGDKFMHEKTGWDKRAWNFGLISSVISILVF